MAAIAAEDVLGECGGTLYVANPPGRAAPTCAPPRLLEKISHRRPNLHRFSSEILRDSVTAL